MYPVIFIDAIVVKVRDGQVRNKPIYVVVGVTVHGERDIFGLWAGDGGEGAKFWMEVLTELNNRGVQDVFFLVCDGLKALPDSVNAVWAGRRAGLHHSSDPQHVPLRLPEVLGPAAQTCGRSTPPHRRGRGRCRLEEFEEKWATLSGDQPAVAQRLGGVHPVPGLRRRDPQGVVQHQRDRKPERPLPAAVRPAGTSPPSRPP